MSKSAIGGLGISSAEGVVAVEGAALQVFVLLYEAGKPASPPTGRLKSAGNPPFGGKFPFSPGLRHGTVTMAAVGAISTQLA